MLKSGLPPVSTAMALKFLMARKFDVTRASKLFKRHLEVRVKYKMAEMKPLDEPLSKELLSEKLTILVSIHVSLLHLHKLRLHTTIHWADLRFCQMLMMMLATYFSNIISLKLNWPNCV